MKGFKRYLSLLLTLVMLATCIVVPTGMMASADGKDYQKRIVGYFLAEARAPDAISTVGTSLQENIDNIDYDSLTHLNVAFMVPADTTSAVPDWKISDMSDDQVKQIIKNCHDHNVKCILSVGGGATNGYKFFESEARSTSFYNQIIEFLDEYGFDGIDMDIESTSDKANYSALLSKLSGDLKSRGKILSMAVAPYIIEGLGTNVSYFDFFNVMTYDQNGSGTDNVAAYDWTVSQLGSYAYQSIPKAKMNLGLPFYGYSTDGRPAWNGDYDYAKVVKMCLEQGNTDFLTKDSISFPGELNQNRPGEAFKVEFNSEATILKKVQNLVVNGDLGGAMVWDVTKDCIREDNKQYALLPKVAAMLAYPSTFDGADNLVASDLTKESVHLEWDGPSSYNPSGYKVYNDTTLLGTITTTNTCCVVSDLSEGFTYNFKVVAIDPDGAETAPAQVSVTTPGTPALPSLPEYSAGTFYPSGSSVIYNGQVWKARWGGSGETPTGVSGNMWVLDESISITPAKNPKLNECEEHGVPTAPTITTTSLADGRVGSAYNKNLTAKGTKPMAWAIVDGKLPDGLTLNASTGAITGTPTVEGTFNFTVGVNNGIGTATAALSILIKAKPDIPGGGEYNEPGTSKRTLGYIPWWRAEESKQLDFAKLDYVIVAFLRYTKDGWDFGGLNNTIPWSDSDLNTLIANAHAAGSKVFISVGGGDGGFIQSSLPFWYENSREYLANCIFEVVDKYGFDGIDMDAETDDIKFWQGYKEFVELLRVGCDARGLEMSMAVHPWYTELIEDEAEVYAMYDFLNVMGYDCQYARSGEHKGIGEVDHAPMWHTYQLLDHYAEIGVPADKMNVGIPFYYYRASLGWDGAVSYAFTKDGSGLDGVTIDTLPGESKTDAWKRTTSQKAYLGGTEYGGAFVWELGQDTLNDKTNSLLTILYDGVKNSKVSTPLDPSDREYPELAPVNGTDLPLTPVDRASTQPDFPALGGSGSGTGTGSASGTDTGEFSWSKEYHVGDIVSYQGSLYQCLRDGWAQNQPQGAGYDNANWKYLGPVGSIVIGGGDEPSTPAGPVDDGDRVLIAPYWWIDAKAGETLTISVPSGESVKWSVRAINGADPAKSSIVSVDDNGVVKALSEGCAVIDAKVGSTRVASLNVRVSGEGGDTPVVPDEPVAPTITTASLANGKVGSAYNKTLTATGTKPIAWGIVDGKLPDGLSLNASTGAITGTPTVAGTFNFTVGANNGVGSIATKAFTVVIEAKPEEPEQPDVPGGSSKRTLGYIPWWRAEESKQLDFAKLDYVIVAFLRYTKDGWDFGGLNNTIPWSDSDLNTLIANAHAAGSKVFISVGGGDGGFIQSSLPFWYENSREYLANCIFEVVDKYGFDGIDMDAETDDVKFWKGYQEFVELLRVGCDARGLEMSMAVHPWYTELIENEAEVYAMYDFLNVMGYDCQYARSGEHKGIGEVDHAPMWHSYQLLDHYTEIGVPADKLNVGIPFYYYRAGLGWDGAVSYAYTKDGSGLDGVTIDTLPGESKTDAWKRTTSQKAYLGGTEYGGAFVWELGQDTLNDKSNSLLTILYDGVKNGKVSTPLDPSDREYPALAPVNGTDLPLTPVDRESTQPDFPSMGGSGSGSGSATGTDKGAFSWSTNYAVGDIVSKDGYLYQCLKAGWPSNQPQGAGYSNDNWKYLGPVGSIVIGGGDEPAGPSDDGDRVLIAPYWWIDANVGDTLTISVPSGESVKWSVRAINGASPAKSSIVSVDDNGVVKALAEGCAVIDAKVGSTRVASLNVRVGSGSVEPPVEPEADVFVFKIDDPNIYYANDDVKFVAGTAPFMQDGKAIVPLRSIASAAGISDLKYDAATKKITFTGFDGYKVEMQSGSTKCTLTKGAEVINIDIVAPFTKDGSAMLPLRDTTNLVGGYVKYSDHYIVVSKDVIDDADVAGYIAAYDAK